MTSTSPAALSASVAPFQRALHAWYRTAQRPLPWRTAPSLYKTVVSELMLQQTQIATALPYFDRWLRELPDFATLAAASEDKVMKLWEGLGYYSRARNLHKLAQAVAARPAPPRTPAEWRELPGIGPYTAAAITSIAFDEPAACVDGNVVRILARLTGEQRTFRDSSDGAKYFTPLAEALIAGSHPGTHNQAMMELGATICHRRSPQCLICPVASFCAARAHDPEQLPRLQPKVIVQKAVTRAVCVHDGRLLLHRAAAGARRLAGLHELPELGSLGIEPDESTLLIKKRRAITRYQITESFHRVSADVTLRRRAAGDATLVWLPVDELEDISLSGPHRRWLPDLLARASAPVRAPAPRRRARARA